MNAPDYRTTVVIEGPPRRSGLGLYLRHEGRMHQLLNTEFNKLPGHPAHLTIYLGPPEGLIETPTTEPTCENTCESAEPPSATLLAPSGQCDSCDRRRALLNAAKKRHREERRGG